VFLAEWASAFYPAVPAWQAHYIDQMKSYVLANPRIEAALYWNNRGAFGCRFSIADDHLSVTALAGVGRALHGRVTG
jgi:hypothetical protein